MALMACEVGAAVDSGSREGEQTSSVASESSDMEDWAVLFRLSLDSVPNLCMRGVGGYG
jgi:hypothetical protein